jgi:E3 ubiquitin-protein ligase TRIP12
MQPARPEAGAHGCVQPPHHACVPRARPPSLARPLAHPAACPALAPPPPPPPPPPSPSPSPRPRPRQAFCARLLTIEYIDLAEQSLQALDKLSNEHPAALLQQGGLTAVLSYLDFFPTGVQRVAVNTAAKMCAALAPTHAGAVRDAVPLLTNLLAYQDSKIVDAACAALCCVAEAFAADPALLELLLSAGATGEAARLVALDAADGGGTATQLSLGTYYSLIRLLATCAAGSAPIAEALLTGPLVGTLRQLLATSSMLSASGGQACVLRTTDQLSEVVGLAAALLPPVPDVTTVMLQGLPSRPPAGGADAAAAAAAAAAAPSGPGAGRGAADAAAAAAAARVAFLREHPEVLSNYTAGLLPLLLQVYSSTVLPGVRHRCLATIVKALYFSTPAQLEAALADLPISSFIASLLGGRDAKAQAYALQMGELLMEQLPGIFAAYFVKEGVVHAVQQLAEQAAGGGGGGSSAATAAGGGAAPAAPALAGGSRDGGASPPSPPVTRSRRASQQGKDGLPEPSQDVREASRDRMSGDAGATTSAPPPPAAAATASLQQQQPGLGRAMSRSASVTLREAVLSRAGSFRDTHFGGPRGGGGAGAGAGGDGGNLESSTLRELRAACAALPGGGAPALERVLALLAAPDLSVFELLTSGAVRALSDHLRGADLAAGPARDEQLLKRLRGFAAAALAPATLGGSGGAMAAIVRKLQGALASTEAFPVVCSRVGAPGVGAPRSLGRSNSMGGSFGAGGGSLSSGLQALIEPFKLRLVRHPNVSAVAPHWHRARSRCCLRASIVLPTPEWAASGPDACMHASQEPHRSPPSNLTLGAHRTPPTSPPPRRRTLPCASTRRASSWWSPWPRCRRWRTSCGPASAAA